MASEGCVFQERLGWERPGWFSVDKEKPAVKEYDYYGAYQHQTLEPYDYKDKLALDYTFEYPKMHENVSIFKSRKCSLLHPAIR
jgi:sarcosine dehydrogenase